MDSIGSKIRQALFAVVLAVVGAALIGADWWIQGLSDSGPFGDHRLRSKLGGLVFGIGFALIVIAGAGLYGRFRRRHHHRQVAGARADGE